MIDELRGRGVRYAAGREMLAQRLAHQVLLRDGGLGRDARRPGAEHRGPVASGEGLRDAHWPALDAVKLVFRLVSDAEFLAVHAGGLLDANEQHLLQLPRGRGIKTPRSVAAWRPSLADLVLVDEVADLLN